MDRTRPGLRPWTVLVVAVVTLFALLAAACGDGGGNGGGGDDADAEVEAFLRQLYSDYNAKDVDALLAAVTDKLLQDEIGVTREEAPDVLAEFIGDPPQIISEISNIGVSGETATADVAFTTGNVANLERDSLIREGGVWKLDGFETLTQEIPEGVTAIDLTATEYRFDFDEAAITSGNIAFNFSNIGGEQHLVDIQKVPADVDIEQALQSDEEPAGVEAIGGIEPVDSGSDATLLFAQPLEAGRYVLFCWVEAADGEPHALKGMWAEFTIE